MAFCKVFFFTLMKKIFSNFIKFIYICILFLNFSLEYTKNIIFHAVAVNVT